MSAAAGPSSELWQHHEATDEAYRSQYDTDSWSGNNIDRCLHDRVSLPVKVESECHEIG